MKTKNLFRSAFVMLFAFSMFTISCKSDDDGGGGGSVVGEGQMTYKVDGMTITTGKNETFGLLQDGSMNFVGVITESTLMRSLNITFAYDGPGTYHLTPLPTDVILYLVTDIDPNNPGSGTSDGWMVHMGEGSATVTVTEHTGNHVIGTFEITAVHTENNSTKHITDGAFHIILD